MTLTRPNPNTYWVIPGQLLAGEYPGAGDVADTRRRLQHYLRTGVSLFVDLTRPGGLTPYEPILRQEANAAGLVARYVRRPIPNYGVPPSAAHMAETLDIIDNAMADGSTVYVHCWGGIGRTGTVVGCFLVRHDRSGAAALRELQTLYETVEKSAWYKHSPETAEQRQLVLDWADLDTEGKRDGN